MQFGREVGLNRLHRVREALEDVHAVIVGVTFAWIKYKMNWRSGFGWYAVIDITKKGEWHRHLQFVKVPVISMQLCTIEPYKSIHSCTCIKQTHFISHLIYPFSCISVIILITVYCYFHITSRYITVIHNIVDMALQFILDCIAGMHVLKIHISKSDADDASGSLMGCVFLKHSECRHDW